MTIPANVQAIGDEAFSGCTKLESVMMQNGVQFIGYAAFAHCQNLTRITIPKTVTYIGKWGFGKSPNAEIVLAEGISSTTIYRAGGFWVWRSGRNFVQKGKNKKQCNNL